MIGKKVAINREPKLPNQAWGGGNALLFNLCKRIVDHGAELVFTPDADADLAIIYDPRGSEPWIKAYRSTDCKTKVVARCGDMGTHGKPEIPELLYYIGHIADLMIFPSRWAENMARTIIWTEVKMQVIQNVPDDQYFVREPPKVVTHHWSDNPKKGKYHYEKLMEKVPEWGFQFTFIGRPCFKPNEHVCVIPPMEKQLIQAELQRHDYYLTASEEEAGANHVLEAMAANLIILHSGRGGSIPDYVGMQGIEFRGVEELEQLLNVGWFPRITPVCDRYVNHFHDLLNPDV